MVARFLLGLLTCLFLGFPSFAAVTNSGFKEVFDDLDALTCEQAESILRTQGSVASAVEDSIDTKYLRRIIETYALVSRCALNKNTRVELYDALLKGMVDSLKDPHSEYINEAALREQREQTLGSFFGIGIHVSGREQDKESQGVLVAATVPGAPAEKAGLMAGDIITHINGRSVMLYKDTNALKRDLKGDRGTTVNLLVARKGDAELLHFSVVRDEIKTAFQKTTLLQNKWFLAQINSFEGEYVGETKMLQLCVDIRSAYQRALSSEPKLKGFILDLRDNPGGFLHGAQCVVDLFAGASLRGKALISVEERDGLKHYPTKINPQNLLNGKPLVVLVDEYSASASEIVAKAVQYYDIGVVVGTRTFGKGSIQFIQPLSDNKTAVKYTYAQYLIGPPNAAAPVQGVGVTPNILARSKEDKGVSHKNSTPVLRESDIVGALATSSVAKDIVVQKTEITNPALYIEIYNLITQAPFNMEVVDEMMP